MKRVFTTIVMLALLCACMTGAALAAEIDLTYDLTADGSNSATVKTGDIITVTYTIHGSADYSVNAIQNEIKFDENFFEFVEGSAQSGVGVAHLVNKLAGPRVYMNDTLDSYAAEQVVGTFQLKVIADSGSGKVESTECLAYDGDGQAMSVTQKDLTVTIAGSTPVIPDHPDDPVTPDNPDKPDDPGKPDKPSTPSTPSKPSKPSTPGTPSTPDKTDEPAEIQVNIEGSGGAYTVEFTYGDGAAPIKRLDEPMKVSVPASVGDVVAAIYSDGTQAVLGKSLVENGKAYFLLDGSAMVQIISNAKSFVDVADSAWYKSAVDFASGHELFNGVSDMQFGPDMSMTRAMLATVLYRLEGEPAAAAANPFTDVEPNAWYTDAVIWANENQIVEGYGNGLFGTGDNVTREQLATILYRYMRYLGLDVSAAGGLNAFPDGGQASAWALEGTQWAVGSGIITGKDGGVLDPGGTATRAEVATMLMRLVGLMVK